MVNNCWIELIKLGSIIDIIRIKKKIKIKNTTSADQSLFFLKFLNKDFSNQLTGIRNTMAKPNPTIKGAAADAKVLIPLMMVPQLYMTMPIVIAMINEKE